MDRIVIKRYDTRKRNERRVRIEQCPYLSFEQNLKIIIKALENGIEDYSKIYKEETRMKLENKLEKIKKELKKLKK